MGKFYAHSLDNDPDPTHWQELETHLQGVAEKAAQFAEAFGARDWGYLAGLWHDLGKYQPEFQARLQGERIAVEHSGMGAAQAFQKDKAGDTPGLCDRRPSCGFGKLHRKRPQPTKSTEREVEE